MENERAGTITTEFVKLKPKIDSILKADLGQKGPSKGAKKYIVKKHIMNEQYKAALFHHKMLWVWQPMTVFRSQKHRIYGQNVSKVSLSPLGTMPWITVNVIDTLSYGDVQWLQAAYRMR